jgi:hypothetical protein
VDVSIKGEDEIMAFVTDPVVYINLILCVIVVVLGFAGYRWKANISSLLIGIAFGLFGLSHLYTLIGFTTPFEAAILSTRTVGYLLVAAALYLLQKEK